jgi:hypothetical protein
MPEGRWLSEFGPLRDEHFTTGVQVVESEDLVITRAVVADDAGHSGSANNPHGFYGLVETLVTGAGGGMGKIAQQLASSGYPAPLQVDIPSGAALSTDAPVRVADLVPGVVMTVEVGGCRPVSQAQRLLDVNATWAAGDEQIAVTLGPAGAAHGAS